MDTAKAPTATTRLDAKDLAVFIPLFGSSLAIAYEVGSFIPLGSGAFALFNLSDHLLWALRAVPTVLIIFAAITVLMPLYGIARSLKGRRWKCFLRVVAAVCLCFGLFLLVFGWLKSSVFELVVGFGAMTVAILAITPSVLRTFSLQFTLLILFGLVAAMAAGIDASRAQLHFTCLADFNLKAGVQSAVLVRSGERGLLLFDPSQQKFTFEKWDDLKNISWLYLPFRQPELKLNWNYVIPLLTVGNPIQDEVRTKCKLTGPPS